MPQTQECPECGAEIPPDAAEGVCPKCLMKLGLEGQETSPVDPHRAAEVSPRFTAPEPEQLSGRFPQLEILELLGQGGMGAVYKARQPALDRLVAVKILPPEVAEEPGFTERFTREARALAKLNHPSVVSVHDFGQVDGQFHFVMEFVDGLNLRQMLKEGKLKPREALAIVPQICEALQYAHDEGLVHRDIKPENILLDKKGRVKIADFGLAKLFGKTPADLNLTGSGYAMGTPHYMSPEQMEHPLEVDHRADIYSLGVVFYEMLTGELPMGRFDPPSKKVQVDVRLDDVVLKSLEKEPRRRYQQASEVKTDVESISGGGQPAEATPDSSGRSSPAEAGGGDREPARQQVRGPALGLLVAGIVNSVGSILTLLFLGLKSPSPSMMLVIVGSISVFVLVCGGLTLVGGLKMMTLRRYRMAILGSIFAMTVPPGNLVGLPVGIWAVVVLTSPEVRAAFVDGRDPSPE